MKNFQLELRKADKYVNLGVLRTIFDEPSRLEVEDFLNGDLCNWYHLTRIAFFITCKLNNKISDSVHARMILGEQNVWTKRYNLLVSQETFGQWII